jgi:hypothetical protein
MVFMAGRLCVNFCVETLTNLPSCLVPRIAENDCECNLTVESDCPETSRSPWTFENDDTVDTEILTLSLLSLSKYLVGGLMKS